MEISALLLHIDTPILIFVFNPFRLNVSISFHAASTESMKPNNGDIETRWVNDNISSGYLQWGLPQNFCLLDEENHHIPCNIH